MPTTLNRDSLRAFANEHREEFEGLLRQFVETPTVSVDPAHAPDIARGLDLTVATIERVGGEARVYRLKRETRLSMVFLARIPTYLRSLSTITWTCNLRRRRLSPGIQNPLSSQRTVTPYFGRGNYRRQRSGLECVVWSTRGSGSECACQHKFSLGV
jgi:hypothetical protein